MRKPLFDRIILKRIEPEKLTKNGIIIPDSVVDSGEYFYNAEVLAVGSEVKYTKVGDKLSVNKMNGWDWREDDIWYRMIRETDILFINE